MAQLPEGLKHVFLGAVDTFPFIISSKLDVSQEQWLITMPSEHKVALGWMIANIKAIIPSIFSHRINLEGGAIP